MHAEHKEALLELMEARGARVSTTLNALPVIRGDPDRRPDY